MAIFDFLSGLISPVTNLIGKIVTKDEDKMQIQASILQMQTGLADKLLDYEKQLNDLQAKVIISEAQGASWLQRNWRPILMLTIVSIVANNYVISPYLRAFGVAAPALELPDHLWTLMQIGVGGYIAGRSAEKIAPSVAEALTAFKKK